MKSNCYYCKNHTQKGIKHTCSKCKTKIIYGEILEKFIEGCPHFKTMKPNK